MSFPISGATPDDAATILGFITELAVIWKRLATRWRRRKRRSVRSIFGEGSVTEAVILEANGKPPVSPSGFTAIPLGKRRTVFTSRISILPGLSRLSGAGKLLLKHLAKVAVDKGCRRFEWSVLDWNDPAIRVYDAIGAEPQNEWIRYRLSGETLKAFATARERFASGRSFVLVDHRAIKAR